MTIKVGINGLGRIGRMLIRAIIETKNKNIEIKHINNRSNSEIGCNLLKYDSVHGKFDTEINFDKDKEKTVLDFSSTIFLYIMITCLAVVLPSDALRGFYLEVQQPFFVSQLLNEFRRR